MSYGEEDWVGQETVWSLFCYFLPWWFVLPSGFSSHFLSTSRWIKYHMLSLSAEQCLISSSCYSWFWQVWLRFHYYSICLNFCSACIPIDGIQDRTTYIPQWYEWLLLSKIFKDWIFYSCQCFSLGLWIASYRTYNSGWENRSRALEVRFSFYFNS